MVTYAEIPVVKDGKLPANITHFARALRKAGVPVGPARVIDAIRAIEVAGFRNREDFYYTLQACFTSRAEHLEVYAQVFRLFWRDPQYLEHMMAILMPAIRGVQKERQAKSAERRAAEALLDGAKHPLPDTTTPEEEVAFDASLTFSAEEKLRHQDFEQMGTEELNAAKRAIAEMQLDVPPVMTRRHRPCLQGRRADWHETMRKAMRRGGEMQYLSRQSPVFRWPNLVALCDISGSMSTYSRMLLHFLHATAQAKGAGWAQVHAFTFGTKLTNVSRNLRARDVDSALSAIGQDVQDWNGGTRIGTCLESFNRDWSRRVLNSGAVVLLITDGLDRGEGELLEKQAQRLHLSCRKLIWLNPLLRWQGFAPKAQGVRQLLPQVDSFLACHNLNSLSNLTQALSTMDNQSDKRRLISML